MFVYLIIVLLTVNRTYESRPKGRVEDSVNLEIESIRVIQVLGWGTKTMNKTEFSLSKASVTGMTEDKLITRVI